MERAPFQGHSWQHHLLLHITGQPFRDLPVLRTAKRIIPATSSTLSKGTWKEAAFRTPRSILTTAFGLRLWALWCRGTTDLQQPGNCNRQFPVYNCTVGIISQLIQFSNLKIPIFWGTSIIILGSFPKFCCSLRLSRREALCVFFF